MSGVRPIFVKREQVNFRQSITEAELDSMCGTYEENFADTYCLYCPEADVFSVEAPIANCLVEAKLRNTGNHYGDNPAPSWIVVPATSQTLGTIEAIVATRIEE